MKSINKAHEAKLPYSTLLELLDYDSITGIFTGIFTNKKARGPRGKKGAIAGSVDQKGYVIIKINNIPYKAHRLAWLYVYKEWPDDLIDHKNDNKSDNSIDNLQVVTNQVNVNKAGLKSNNTSGYRGVWLEGTRWASQFRYLGEHFYLGAYNTPELASEAYENFRKEHNI